MYKVLIVDDEPFILEGIRKIINWEELGLEIVGQAANGIEAMNFIENNKVHILITDVKMPKMNGLELIKVIKGRELNIKCINLSGYEDFKYVKEAAKLGIENYLLKPVDIDELTSTLMITVSKIDAELYKVIENRQDISIIRDNILFRMVTDDIKEDELLERVRILDIKLNYSTFSVALFKIDYESNGKVVDKSLLRFSVHNICSDIICCHSKGTVFCNFDGDIVILFFEPPVTTELRIILEKCIKSINEYLNTDVFVTVGSEQHSYMLLHQSYTQAKKLQEYSIIMDFNRILFYDKISHSGKALHRDVHIDFNTLAELIASRKMDLCSKYIHNLYSTISMIEELTPSCIQNITIEILINITSFIRRIRPNMDTPFKEFKDLFATVFRLKNTDDMRAWIEFIIYRCIALLDKEDEKASPVVRKVMNYVYSHYAQEQNLKTLSNEFNINPIYLGQLFKKEIGESFTNFLNRIRIEKAKEMLTKTNLKTSEISEKIGYTNPNYFYILFKKVTGVSPSRYRTIT